MHAAFDVPCWCFSLLFDVFGKFTCVTDSLKNIFKICQLLWPWDVITEDRSFCLHEWFHLNGPPACEHIGGKSLCMTKSNWNRGPFSFAPCVPDSRCMCASPSLSSRNLTPSEKPMAVCFETRCSRRWPPMQLQSAQIPSQTWFEHVANGCGFDTDKRPSMSGHSLLLGWCRWTRGGFFSTDLVRGGREARRYVVAEDLRVTSTADASPGSAAARVSFYGLFFSMWSTHSTHFYSGSTLYVSCMIIMYFNCFEQNLKYFFAHWIFCCTHVFLFYPLLMVILFYVCYLTLIYVVNF